MSNSPLFRHFLFPPKEEPLRFILRRFLSRLTGKVLSLTVQLIAIEDFRAPYVGDRRRVQRSPLVLDRAGASKNIESMTSLLSRDKLRRCTQAYVVVVSGPLPFAACNFR
jgi:hypothetical protein